MSFQSETERKPKTTSKCQGKLFLAQTPPQILFIVDVPAEGAYSFMRAIQLYFGKLNEEFCGKPSVTFIIFKEKLSLALYG